jgi:hypothetical protein
MKYVFSFILALCPILIWAQPFVDKTTQYKPSLQTRSGSAGICTDINGDQREDLILIESARKIVAGINNGPNNPMTWYEGPEISNFREYLSIASDLDNDGFPEIITSGAFTDTKVLKFTESDGFTLNQVLTHNFFAQAGNTIDLNRDGFLDVFICSDEDDNVVAMNDGNGHLIKNDTLFDWTTSPVSDNSGNYGSEWVDVNGDRLLDLYIAKCRAGVSDPSDPRRINRLYMNHDSFFVDEAVIRGVDVNHQSWTGSFADWDNDGDADLLVTNHYAPHQFFSNDGNGFYTEIFPLEEALSSFAFQSIWRDFNNDGFIDVLITGYAENFLLLNQGGTSFEVVRNPVGSAITSGVVGDIDGDGLFDIIGFYSTNINVPGSTPDKIWINENEKNHNYLNVYLKGIISNRQGIGSLISIYTKSGVQTRTIKGGESYGISTPLYAHFGLGENDEIDSITVHWPSGTVDRLGGFKVDIQTITLEEGKCVNPSFMLETSANFLCEDTVTLVAPENYSFYEWNTGSTGNMLKINSPGTYLVIGQDSSGCIARSVPVKITDGKAELPLIIADKSLESCLGDTVKFTVHSGKLDTFNWIGYTQLDTIYTTSGGVFKLTGTDQCGNTIQDSVTFTPTSTVFDHIKGDTVPKGGNGYLIAIGDRVAWYTSENSNQPISIGDTLKLFNVTESRSYYTQNTVASNGLIYDSNKSIDTTLIIPPNPSTNHKVFFTAYTDFWLESVDMYAEIEGIRRITIENELAQEIASHELYINPGWHTYPLGIPIDAGLFYSLSTDTAINNVELGTNGPGLWSVHGHVDYPYRFGNVMEVVSSSGGSDFYPYFFNMKIRSEQVSCTGPRAEVKVVLDNDVSILDLPLGYISIQPNPVNDFVRILSDGVKITEILLFDSKGILLKSYFNPQEEIDVRGLKSGMYFLKIQTTSGHKSFKIMK